MAISCNPVDLVVAATCYQCADAEFADAMNAGVLCQWAQGGQVGSTKWFAGEGAGEMILGEGGDRIEPEA